MLKDRDCVFCSIVERKINTKIIAENDSVVAFHDFNPAASFHILIIPKIHIQDMNTLAPEHGKIITDMFMMVQELAQKMRVDNTGYRLVINTGYQAGQSVFHLHIHFLAGREFSWPPG